MLTFAFIGTVADVDETMPGDPDYPSAVLMIEVGETISSVILPDDVLQDRRELLCTGRPVEVFGEVEGFPKDATPRCDAPSLSRSRALTHTQQKARRSGLLWVRYLNATDAAPLPVWRKRDCKIRRRSLGQMIRITVSPRARSL
jgi:hypothetical protein